MNYTVSALSVSRYHSERTVIGEVSELTEEAIKAFFASLSHTPRFRNTEVVAVDFEDGAAEVAVGSAYSLEVFSVDPS